MLNNCRVIIYTTFLLMIVTTAMASSGWIIYSEGEFKGKVIDAETIKPIEGAVVAAIYFVHIGPFAHGSVVADIQETLTDSNGEFTIPGNIFFFFAPFGSGDRTKFIIFKPGYRTYPFNDFLIYAVGESAYRSNGDGMDPEDKEGIVFEKKMKSKRGRRLYKKRYEGIWLPFIPLKDPLEKVRNLDIPFDSNILKLDKIDRNKIWTYDREPFRYFALIGLSKYKTMEEGRKTSCSIPSGFKHKVPIWKKMLDDE